MRSPRWLAWSVQRVACTRTDWAHDCTRKAGSEGPRGERARGPTGAALPAEAFVNLGIGALWSLAGSNGRTAMMQLRQDVAHRRGTYMEYTGFWEGNAERKPGSCHAGMLASGPWAHPSCSGNPPGPFPLSPGAVCATGGAAVDQAADGEAAGTDEEIHEWVADGFFLVHRWESCFGKRPFKATRVLAYEPARADCFTRLLERVDRRASGDAEGSPDLQSKRLPCAQAMLALTDAGASVDFAWSLRDDASDWEPICALISRRSEGSAPRAEPRTVISPSCIPTAHDRLAALNVVKPKPARLGWIESLRWNRARPAAVPCAR